MVDTPCGWLAAPLHKDFIALSGVIRGPGDGAGLWGHRRLHIQVETHICLGPTFCQLTEAFKITRLCFHITKETHYLTLPDHGQHLRTRTFLLICIFRMSHYAQKKWPPWRGRPKNTQVPSRQTRPQPPPTWELNGEARLADEEVTVELQRERAEGAVDVLGEHGAAPLLEQDVAVQRAVPHLQDVVGRLCVEHDEVQAVGESTACTLTHKRAPRATGAPRAQAWMHTRSWRPAKPTETCLVPPAKEGGGDQASATPFPGASENYRCLCRIQGLPSSVLSYVSRDPNNSFWDCPFFL